METIKGKFKIMFVTLGLLILIGCASIENEVDDAEQGNRTIENENEDESLNYKSIEDYEKAQQIEGRIIEFYEAGDYDTLIFYYKQMFILTVNKIKPTRKTLEVLNELAKDMIEKSDDYSLVSSYIYSDLLNEDVLALYKSKFSKEIARSEKENAEWEKKQEQAEAERKAEYEVKRKEYAAEREKYERSQQGVRIGMTQEEVLLSNWGKPLDINKTTNAYGTSEQWVYRDFNYLYFEDGILTTIQN
ncbi:hypothetical protein ACIP9G_09485 [Lysinibacillus sp. NPDC093197]|uniref:hypothetical protein n=1 Tax=Lysinibacillus sp. NPDC093197 TaxID=3364132 RepID=UPI00380C3FCA